MTITPTLHFSGNCAEAIALYEEAFGLMMDFVLRYKTRTRPSISLP